MKICPKCGSENKNEAKFCNECGNKLMPEVTAVEDVNDSVSDNVESFAENSDKDKDVEENISSTEIGNSDTAKDSESTSKKTPFKMNYILFAIGAVCLLFVMVTLFGSKSPKKNNYYVEPRVNYEITDPDFDFLIGHTKEEIEQLLEANIEWYNDIEYNERKKVISMDDVTFDSLMDKWSTLTDNESNIKTQKIFLAISPAIKTLSDFASFVDDYETEKNENGETNYIINISSDEWMKLHDDLQEALAFYYGDGDHTEMNLEELNYFRVLTDDDKKFIEGKLDDKLVHESWLERVNTNYSIDVEQNSDGTLDITYRKYIYETKSEFINGSKEIVNTYQKIWDLLQPVAYESGILYGGESLRVEVYGTGNELLIWVDDSGASYVH